VLLVGRDLELHHLHRCLDESLSSRRQFLFVTGEAGLGKTTLVDTFLEAINADGSLWIGHGQCLEHYGAGEAYMPVLEALGRLCRGADGQDIVALLAQHAPTWLVHLPGLLSPAGYAALQQQVFGATQGRMLREMAETLERLTARRPLVLVLEDLHWSDYATLDLLAALAKRREPARLLLVATYRPPDVLQRGHPLRQMQHDLRMHGQCEELPLSFLTETAVAAYLVARFPQQRFPSELSRLLHQRTAGNPLFVVHTVEDWLARGWLAQVDGLWMLQTAFAVLEDNVPEGLRQMLSQQFERLSPLELQVLEAGSVAGREFTAAAVAAALACLEVDVEACCAALMRQGQGLQALGEQRWPDGSVTEGYRFAHALYQDIVYHQLPAVRRALLHQRIGEREEIGYGTQVERHAAVLAIHFERSRDTSRALRYRCRAADNALQRFAHAEAIAHFRSALQLLSTLPDTLERARQELRLQCALGASLTIVKGYASPEVVETYTRARELCQQVGEASQIFSVLWGLLQYYMVRAELDTARALGEQLVHLAQNTQDPMHLISAHNGLGTVLTYRGELPAARTHLELSRAFYTPQHHDPSIARYGIDLGVDSPLHAAHTLWFLGYAERARRQSDDACALAQSLSHPFSQVHAFNLNALIHHFCGSSRMTQKQAESAIRLADEQGFALELAEGMILRGWAMFDQGQHSEGLAQMHQGLATYQATDARNWALYYGALLAEAYGLCGHVDRGLSMLGDALRTVQASGESLFATELHRLQGELLWRLGAPTKEVEASLKQALTLARRQHSRALELRAAMSFCRVWQQDGKRTHAYRLLAPVYGWFTEGFDTADLQAAKTLLAEMA
jgi:predicted ATPase